MTKTQTVTVALALIVLAGNSHAVDLPFHGDTVVRFATPKEGRLALVKRDRFIESLGRFDLQSRLKTDREVTVDDLLKFVAGEVRQWDKEEIEKLSGALKLIDDQLKEFDVPLPKTILLVKTSGKEEGDAAYCRGNAIVLPQRIVNNKEPALERLMIHELFHIVSSDNPDLRKKLYAIIGFQPCNQIAIPKMFKDRKITNPDAPTIDYFIELKHDDKVYQAAPLLYASEDNYDPNAGKSFFQYLLFRMLVIKRSGGKWRAVEKDGKPVVLNVSNSNAYFEQIGRNTNYIIHPDEILADNFVHLVKKTESLKTPRIVEEMKAALAK